MSEAVWYYAQNDQERGPVTLAELRSLAASGKLQGSDLVWKDGMEDWTSAAQVKGLLLEPTPPPAAKPEGASRNKTPAARDASSRDVQPRDVPARDVPRRESPGRDARWIDGPPADDTTPSTVPRVPMAPTGVSPVRTSQPQMQPQLQRPAELGFAAAAVKYLRPAGVGLACVGLLLVLGARGCDLLARRYVARVTALATVEEQAFQQEWDKERRQFEADIEALRTKPNKTPGDDLRRQQYEDSLQQLNERKRKEQEELRNGRWADLQSAAATAGKDDDAWSFWRGLVFVFGTAVLLPGLLILAFTGSPPERWMSLVILAVIVFSLFVGGTPWTAAAG